MPLRFDLHMVEILCIAAEITAVLLVASLAYPVTTHVNKKKTEKSKGEPEALDEGLLINKEESVHATRLLAYLQGSRWFSNTSLEGDQAERDRLVGAWCSRVRDIEGFLPENPPDVLTGLSTRESLERFVDCISSLECPVQIETYISMFQVSNVLEIEQRLGPAASERAVRHASEFLSQRLSVIGPLVRYGMNTFAIAFVGLRADHILESIQNVTSELDQQPATINDNSENVHLMSTLVKKLADQSFDEVWDLLEEGLADAAGDPNKRNTWYDTNDLIWKVVSVVPVKKVKGPGEEPHGDNSKATSVSQEEIDRVNQMETVDVVSSDDIAALFAAARTAPPKKKTESQSNEIRGSQAAPMNKAEEIAQTSAKSELAAGKNVAEFASVEDIQSLFAAAKNGMNSKAAGKDAAAVAATAPAVASASAPTASPAKVELSEEVKVEKASADDIAALFAANRPASKPAATAEVTPSVPRPESVAAESTPPVPAKVELSEEAKVEKASADDIAALFAANRPTTTPAVKPVAKPDVVLPAPETKAKPNAAVAASATTPLTPASALTDLSEDAKVEAASSDDIAALFAAAKNTVKPKAAVKADSSTGATQSSAEVAQTAVAPTSSSPVTDTPELSEEAKAEAATADDIASLFATVKPAIKQPAKANAVVEAPAATVAKPAAVETVVPAIDPAAATEKASADDIAALFAAMKK